MRIDHITMYVNNLERYILHLQLVEKKMWTELQRK